jgi:broad specificity phosphatase PhoE
MKTITFIRHGKPVIWDHYSPFSMINAKRIAVILESYDHCAIKNNVENENKIKNLIKNGDLFISSDLKRAKDSFQLLGITDYQVNSVFNEPRLPSELFNRTVKLPIFIWAILLRVVWLLGYKRDCESIEQFKKRMNLAVHFLENNLLNHHHIIVMAHGFINFFILRRLLKKGWYKIANTTFKKFWSYTQITRNEIK